MSQSDSISLVKRKSILAKSDKKLDRCFDDPKSNDKHGMEFGVFPYDHRKRPLPTDVAKKAHSYIEAIVKQYPFQIRFAMALPLWDRFCQAWCETGNEERSLRSI